MNVNINVGNPRSRGFGGPPQGGCCGGRNPMLSLMRQMLSLMQQMLSGGQGGCPCRGGYGPQGRGTNININMGNQFRGFGF